MDKQKLEDVAKQMKTSASFDSRVGLNVIKDLNKEDQEVRTVEIIKVIETPIKAPVEDREVQTSPTATTPPPFDAKNSEKEGKKSDNVEQKLEKHVLFKTVELDQDAILEDHREENQSTIQSISPQSPLSSQISSNSSAEFSQFSQESVLQQPQQQLQQQHDGLFPICEDPLSHQWYPLPVVCQMFRMQGRVYDLENLLLGSRGIRPEDRKCIYFWTLQAYADCGLFPQAVDLTRRLETEGLAEEFPEYHSLMNNFAMAVYHQEQLLQSQISDMNSLASTNLQTEQSLPPTPASEAEEQLAIQALHHRKLKKALAAKDVKGCLEHYKGLERVGGKEMNITESSTLVELLVKDDLIEDAVNITEKMLSREAYPMPRIFRFFLNRLAAKGEVEAMNRLGVYLTSRVRKEVSFDNRLCNAYLAAGRGKEYLDIMIQDLDLLIREKEATNVLDEEKLQVLKEKFPRGGAMGLLEANPDLVHSYTVLAIKFVQLGYVAPVNVLWSYHFINGRHDLAEPLWNQYVRTCPQIMFQKVCQTARSTANVDLAERLVVLLENAVVTNGARGIAYSCLLDVLTQNQEYTKGVKSLETGLNSGIALEDMNRTALRRLKEGVEAQGNEFPYEIPKKNPAHSEYDEPNSRSLSPTSMLV